MKKFELPKINVQHFMAEEVLTASNGGETPPVTGTAFEQAEKKSRAEGAAKVLRITF